MTQMPQMFWKLLELADRHPVEALGIAMFAVLYAELMFCGPKTF